MATAYPRTKIGARANKTKPSLKGRPADLGPRKGSVSKLNTKSITKTAASPNTKAIVSRTTDPKGRMDKAQMKTVKATAKRKMRSNLKAAAKSVRKGLLKVASRFAGPVGAGLLAADAVGMVRSESKKVKSVKGRPKTAGQMKRKK